jgi:hypothetical protein
MCHGKLLSSPRHLNQPNNISKRNLHSRGAAARRWTMGDKSDGLGGLRRAIGSNRFVGLDGFKTFQPYLFDYILYLSCQICLSSISLSIIPISHTIISKLVIINEYHCHTWSSSYIKSPIIPIICPWSFPSNIIND